MSSLFSLSNILINISVVFYPNLLTNHSETLTIVCHQIGIVSLKNTFTRRIIRLVFPDYFVLLISIAFLIYLLKRNIVSSKSCQNELDKKIQNVNPVNSQENKTNSQEEFSLSNEQIIQQENINAEFHNVDEFHEMYFFNNQKSYMRTTLGIDKLKKQDLKSWAKESLFVFFNVVVAGFAGIILPSILNSIYLFLFLGIGTYWACGKNVVTENFVYTHIVLLVYSALHICLIYLIQIEIFQFYIPDGQFLSRILGLPYLLDTSIKLDAEFIFKKKLWINYASPIIIIYVYYICATVTRRWLERREKRSKDKLFVRDDTSRSKTIQLFEESIIDSPGIPNATDIRENENTSISCESQRIDFTDIPFLRHSPKEHDIAVLLQPKTERPLLLSFINTIIGNSFVFTFIAMMAWSVTYQSWMSFIFLLAACYLWIRPNSRNSCLYASPVIVFYAITLILVQYIYGLNLFELPVIINITRKTQIDLSEIGLQKWDNSFGPLSIMIGYLVIFWLTLRLSMTDKRFNILKKASQFKKDTNDVLERLHDPETYEDNDVYKKTMNLLHAVCEKYWIFACCFAMLYISIQMPVVMFRIVYMVLLVYFLLTFMISYSFWRKQMKVFWWFVIGYSIIILLNIYVFQFKNIAFLWKNLSTLTENNLKDIGLQRYEATSHINDLLVPVIFLVIIIVQVRYFHDNFMKLSSMNRFGNTNFDKDNSNQSNNNNPSINISTTHSDFRCWIKKVSEIIKKITGVKIKIWLFLELHLVKIITISIVYVCILEINACNILLIIIVVIGFPFPRLHSPLIISAFLWCSSIVVMKMIYQLKMVPTFNWTKTCSKNFDLSSKASNDNIKWIGLEKVDHFQKHVWKWTIIMVICVLWHVIKYHQIQFYKNSNIKRPGRAVIFPEISIHSEIDSVLDIFKYCMNFTCFRVGYELSLVVTVIISCLRVDVYSLVYLMLLFIFLFLRRKISYQIWPYYLLVLAIFLPVQYAICVGLPPGLCIDYPFALIDTKLRRWLYLPNYVNPPASEKIMVDFLQFLFVSSQYQAYKLLRANHNSPDNDETKTLKANNLFQKDFMNSKNSYIDYVKHVVFYWSYWLSLGIIFTTGVFWITLFGLGYLILAFSYLWSGQNIILKKKKHLIAVWNVILFYNFVVILSKCTFQLLGCVFINKLIENNLCWMISLFGIHCINPMSWEIINSIPKSSNTQCNSSANGLHWDVVCFFFIIFQRKIFFTKSFSHVTLDIGIQHKFASSGARLINQKIMASIKEQELKQKSELNKVQKKINKIIKRQAQHGKPELDDHYLVIRSGDYYLFDDDSEETDEEYETEKSQSNDVQLDNIKYMDELTSNEANNFSDIPILSSNTIGNSSLNHTEENHESQTEMIDPINLINKFITLGPKATAQEVKRSITESREISVISKRSTLVKQSYLDAANSKSSNNESTFVGGIKEFPSESSSENLMIDSAADQENLFYSGLCHNNSPRDFTFIIPALDEQTNYSNNIETDFSFKNTVDKDEIDNSTIKSCWRRFKDSCIVFGYFIKSSVIHINQYLNGWTQDYRNIRRNLDADKRRMKLSILRQNFDELDGSTNIEDMNDQSQLLNNLKREEELKKSQQFRRSRSQFFTLIILLSNVAFIYSEFGCYILLIFNHMFSGNLLSLPYPLIVFLWAMLSVPRPSKILWIVLITYTETVIVIKYVFQFKYFDFNLPQQLNSKNPLWLPLIIGIDKSTNYALLDVIQLLFIFMHRGYLKNNGLWEDNSEFNQSQTISETNQSLKSRSCCSPIHQKFCQFYFRMTNPNLNRKVDVYSFMFLCEFIALLIIILGYVSFGPGTDSGGHAIDFIKTDKIPVPFIVMIVSQFIFFIIDRALFLRKNVMGKFIFQIFHVFLIHTWLFFALPYITRRKFRSHIAPQLLYFVKCVYFALSAYQMKSGYPIRILGNFLTQNFNYVNLAFFKIYMVIPFLYELRNIMDWMWTDTSVAFYHWMEVEDIFCKIFVLKCWRNGELRWPTQRGRNRLLVVKYIIGGGLLLFLSICIWGPLTISSFIGHTYDKNPPLECTFSIDVGGYSPFFVFSSRDNNMRSLPKEIFNNMKNCYGNHTTSLDFLKSFEAEDISEVFIDGASDNSWLITPPGFTKLKDKLNSSEPLKINMQAICERPTKNAKLMDRVIRFTNSRNLSRTEKTNLLEVLNANGSTMVYLPKIFPRFLTAYKRKFSEADALLKNYSYVYLNLNLSMMLEHSVRWWEVSEKWYDERNCFESSILADDSYLTVYIFNERISDHFFGNIFSNYGILGIYAAYFFVVHRILRAFYSNISYIVQFEEFPDVDRIHKLLNEIYLVRENKKFRLEEQLIAKLIFLYRSSEIRIKWTRHRKSVISKHIENTSTQNN